MGVGCANGERTYTDASSTQKSGYCVVSNAPGGEFYVVATGSCNGPACGPGDIPGSSGPLSEMSSKAYIVGVPSSFSASANPTQLPKQGSFKVRATGLSSIDDGKGSLSVTADFADNSYALTRVSQGTYEVNINYDLRNRKAGPLTLTVTATKSYAGLSDSESRSISMTLLGSKPSIQINAPNEIRRGESFTVAIEEEDGDDVTASMKIGSQTIKLSKGTNNIVVNVPKGAYDVQISASDIDGSEDKSFTLNVRGYPPSVVINAPNEIRRGESFAVTVSEEDGDNVSGTLALAGRSFSIGKGTNQVTVPNDLKAGTYEVHATVSDEDGSSEATTSITIVNLEPVLSLSVDKNEVKVGEALRITVSVEDDSAGLIVRTVVGGEVFQGTGTFTYTPSSPGTLEIRSVATDFDGATVEKSVKVGVKGAESGSSSNDGSGSGGNGESGVNGNESPVGSQEGATNTTTPSSPSEPVAGNGSETVGSAETEASGSVWIEVSPPSPKVSDEVEVRIRGNRRGLLQVFDPEGEEVVNTGLALARFVVGRTGVWKVRFTYKEGSELRVMTREFTVSPVEEVREDSREETKEEAPFVKEEIAGFKPFCMMAESSSPKEVPWLLMFLITLLFVLLIRRMMI